MSRPRIGALAARAAVIGALAVGAYLPGLPGDFVYDDHRLIVDNDGLKRPFEWRRSLMRDYYASDLDRMGLGYYRPVTLLSTEIDYRRGGGRPAAFHTTNIAVHAACAILVLVLGTLVLGEGIGASIAAGLFALHPAHAESVAFISGRVDPLATLFGLTALVAHVLGRSGSRRWAWRAAAALSWLLALGSKEIAVTVPVMALALDLAEAWPGFRELALRFLPYAAVLPAYLGARAIALGSLLPVAPPADFVWSRPVIVLGSYVAWLILPPGGLHLEPAIAMGGWALAAAGLGLLAILAIGALARLGRRLDAALVAGSLVAILPVAQLRPLETVLSERFLYLASVPATLLLGSACQAIASRRGARLALVAGVAAMALYASVLIPRARVWRDEVALWSEYDGEMHGRSIKAKLNLARAYAARGDRQRAASVFEAAARLEPALAPTIRAEAAALSAAQKDDASLRAALAAAPEDGALWNNLGFQLYAEGDTEGAALAFSKAVALTPARGSGWLGLALCRVRAHDWRGADEAAARAAALDPSLGLARALRVQCAWASGQPCEAARLAEGIVLDDPEERAQLESLTAKARGACAH